MPLTDCIVKDCTSPQHESLLCTYHKDEWAKVWSNKPDPGYQLWNKFVRRELTKICFKHSCMEQTQNGFCFCEKHMLEWRKFGRTNSDIDYFMQIPPEEPAPEPEEEPSTETMLAEAQKEIRDLKIKLEISQGRVYELLDELEEMREHSG